jgi:hypothetical protein
MEGERQDLLYGDLFHGGETATVRRHGNRRDGGDGETEVEHKRERGGERCYQEEEETLPYLLFL